MQDCKVYYLAHPCLLMTKVRAWQLRLEGLYNIKFSNPFSENPFENAEELGKITTIPKLREYQKNLPLETCHGILSRDLELIRKSDGVVAYFQTYSIGTIMEIFAASYVYRLPVYVISPNHNYHCWLRSLISLSGGEIFLTRREFARWLDSQGYRRH